MYTSKLHLEINNSFYDFIYLFIWEFLELLRTFVIRYQACNQVVQF